MRQAIIIHYKFDKENNVSEVDALLEEGWKVVFQNTIGLVPIVSALVILE